MTRQPMDTLAAFETALRGPERWAASADDGPGDTPHTLAALFKIRFARTPQSLEVAEELLDRRYASRDYPRPKLVHHPHRTTILVYLETRAIATMTVGYDPGPSSACGSPPGLLADEIYGSELDELRREGRRLGELSKFGIDEGLGLKKSVLGGIFHIAYLYGILHQCTDAVIEVVPEHVGFYRSLLGFRQRGPVRTNPRVHAPVALLHLELETMRERIVEVGGKKMAAGDRTLYPWFFATAEQDEILSRILHAASTKEELHADLRL